MGILIHVIEGITTFFAKRSRVEFEEETETDRWTDSLGRDRHTERMRDK